MAARRAPKKTTRRVTSDASVSAVETPVRENRTNKFPAVSWNRAVPAVYMALLVGAFVLGALWQKVEFIQGGGVGTAQQPAAGTAQQPGEVQVTDAQIKSLFAADVMKFGDDKRKVLFVAIEDPSCPYCSIASGHNPALNKQVGTQFTLVSDGGTYVAPVIEMKKLLDAGKASFVYIYTNGHGNGEMGTKAMYCAYEKDKFWPVHDLLMTAEGYNLLNETVKNDKTKSQVLADFLKPAMNPAELKACLDSGKYDSRIASDSQIAQSLGVTGTPGFFVNTTRYAGAYSYKDMEPTVNSALQ